MLYDYLKQLGGICASHTSGTGMGTDWRNWDPEVEPMVEIYQGDRNNYERPDAPRSAVTEAKLKQSTPERESLGGWEPKGFVNLALKMGRRYAFQSSSDHLSTHLSYCNVFVTEPTRAAPDPWTARSKVKLRNLSISSVPEPLSQAAVSSCVPMLISTGARDSPG